MIPESFEKFSPQNSNHIFQNDPSFPAINLYDFFGRSATVNSFVECYYYVELGFEPNKITIFSPLKNSHTTKTKISFGDDENHRNGNDY